MTNLTTNKLDHTIAIESLLMFAQCGPLIDKGGTIWRCPAIWIIETCIDALAVTRCHEERTRLMRTHDHAVQAMIDHGYNAAITFATWRMIATYFIPVPIGTGQDEKRR